MPMQEKRCDTFSEAAQGKSQGREGLTGIQAVAMIEVRGGAVW